MGMDNKQAAREMLNKKRKALSAKDRAYASLKVGGNIAAFFDAKHIPEDATVAAYWALPDEIDLRPALATLMANGAKAAFPCVHEDMRMEFYSLSAQDLDAERLPAFISHPAKVFPESVCTEYTRIPPENIDVMFVPGVGFDKQKKRLGRGAGCYDRYLARIGKGAITVGIGFDQQLCEEIGRAHV